MTLDMMERPLKCWKREQPSLMVTQDLETMKAIHLLLVIIGQIAMRNPK